MIGIVSTGTGELPKRVDGVRVLVVDGDADAFTLLADIDHGVGVGRC